METESPNAARTIERAGALWFHRAPAVDVP